MISHGIFLAISSAAAVFPDAVGPRMAMTGGRVSVMLYVLVDAGRKDLLVFEKRISGLCGFVAGRVDVLWLLTAQTGCLCRQHDLTCRYRYGVFLQDGIAERATS